MNWFYDHLDTSTSSTLIITHRNNFKTYFQMRAYMYERQID